jgi:hypothetical protein
MDVVHEGQHPVLHTAQRLIAAGRFVFHSENPHLLRVSVTAMWRTVKPVCVQEASPSSSISRSLLFGRHPVGSG